MVPKFSALLCATSALPLHVPQKQIRTAGTKIILLVIRVGNSRGGKHHAPCRSAVGQAEAVSQFMECRFFEAIQEKRFISRGIIKPGMKPVIGNDRACPPTWASPKDILQYGDIQVYIGNRYDFVRTFFAVKMFKYSLGIILLSSFTIGEHRRLEIGQYLAW